MRILILPLALLLAACSGDANSDPAFNTPEAQALKEWARQLKAEDRESMHALIRECGIGAAFGSADDKVATLRCMKQKYDEGVRG